MIGIVIERANPGKYPRLYLLRRIGAPPRMDGWPIEGTYLVRYLQTNNYRQLTRPSQYDSLVGTYESDDTASDGDDAPLLERLKEQQTGEPLEEEEKGANHADR